MKTIADKIPRKNAKKFKRAQEIKAIFLKEFDNPKTELIYSNAFELLCAVMLSAQCTDKRVNIVTPALFAKYPSPKEMSKAKLEDVKELIKSVSFFNTKSQNLIKTATIICEKYGGIVPENALDLQSLPGVGQKTANVVLIELRGANLMAVDTHVFRTSHRLGLSDAKTALETEKDLALLFQTDLSALHQAMVLFGRYLCKAQKPQCEICYLEKYCKYKGASFKPK
ncbi:MAG: endonuclease III [Helicobacter sp.]|nr:endonuclease III [Helicobacter sp.]